MLTDEEIEKVFQTQDSLGLVVLASDEDLTVELMEQLLDTENHAAVLALVQGVTKYKNNMTMSIPQLERAANHPSEIIRVLSVQKLKETDSYRGWPKEWLETKFNVTLKDPRAL